MRVFDQCEIGGEKFAILVDDATMEAMETVWAGSNWNTEFSYSHIGVDPFDVAGELDFEGCRKAGYRFID